MAVDQQLQKEFEKITQEHEQSKQELSNLDKIENFKTNFFNTGALIIAAIAVLASIIKAYKHHDGGMFFSGLLIYGYFSMIGYGILLSIFDSVIDFFARKKFKITKKEIAEIRLKETQLRSRRYALEQQIQQAEESQFADNLSELVTLSEKRKLTKEEISSRLEKLKEYYQASCRFTVHTSVWYLNRLLKVESAVDNYDLQPTKSVTGTSSFKEYKESVIRTPPVKKTAPEEERSIKEIFERPIAEVNNNVSFVEKETETVVDADLERNINELFTPTNQVKEKVAKQYRVSVKTDFIKLNEHRHNIGKLGEQFAIKKEKEKLILQGFSHLVDKIVQVSADDDSAGYDIISFVNDDTPKYIEVKTTTTDHKTPFYLSESEIEAMNKLEHYCIYRVFNFNTDDLTGNYFIVEKDNMDTFFNMEPISYRVKPKN